MSLSRHIATQASESYGVNRLAKNWLAFLEGNFGLLKTVDEAVVRLMTAVASKDKVVLAGIQ